MTPEDLAYLHHILDAILSIEEFSEGVGGGAPKPPAGAHRDRAHADHYRRGCKDGSPELRKEYPEIPWREAAGMRDKIVHHHFSVDYEAVFLALRDDLTILEQRIRAILNEAGH